MCGRADVVCGGATGYAGIAQLVERNLAKVEVASSSLVSRSNPEGKPRFPFSLSAWRARNPARIATMLVQFGPWRGGRVVMQRPAKPCTPVRFRPPPPRCVKKALSYQGFFFFAARRCAQRCRLGQSPPSVSAALRVWPSPPIGRMGGAGRAVDRHGVCFPHAADSGAAFHCRRFGARGNHVPIVGVGTDFWCPAFWPRRVPRPECRARSSTAPNLGLDVVRTAPALSRNTLSAEFRRTRSWRGSYTVWRIWIVISPQKVIEPHRRLAEDPCCAWVFTIVCNMTRVAF